MDREKRFLLVVAALFLLPPIHILAQQCAQSAAFGQTQCPSGAHLVVWQSTSAPPAKAVPLLRAQQALNIFATPVPPSKTIPGLPDSYAAWTQAQKTTVRGQMEGRCLVLWTMMNDSGRVSLLPLQQDSADEATLVLDLCLAARMPHDWPARKATITEAQHILERSTELGKPLVLPKTLQP